jgi:hypothetical protein
VEIKMEGSFHNVPLGISTLTPVKGRRLPDYAGDLTP